MTVHQSARVYAGLFDGDERARLARDAGRRAYGHVARGAVSVNGRRLVAGHAAKLVDEPGVALADGSDARVLDVHRA